VTELFRKSDCFYQGHCYAASLSIPVRTIRAHSGKTKPTLGLIMRASEILVVGYGRLWVVRVSRDPKMRDRLFQRDVELEGRS
jgi:hypothetical protein